MQLNREQRRALKKAKPVKGAGHIQLPINMRFSAEDETKLMLEPIKCAERLRDGSAEEGDWHAVILRLNWGRLLNKAIFNEGESLLSEAQDAMRAIKARGIQYSSWSASTALQPDADHVHPPRAQGRTPGGLRPERIHQQDADYQGQA